MALALWTLARAAFALDVHVLAPEGPPAPGEVVPLELLVTDGARAAVTAAPTVQPARGRLSGSVQPAGPGRWHLHYVAPADAAPDSLQVTVGTELIALPLEIRPEPRPLAPLPAVVTGSTGRALQLGLAGLPPEAARWFTARATEGEAELVANPAGAALAFQPGPEPFPRAIPLALHDPVDGLRPPAFTVVRLNGRPRVPVQVSEPGASVTLVVGGRRYGPFVAGDDRIARTVAEVRPGESVAEVILEDAAGNVQRSSVALGGDQRPAFLAVARPAGPGSDRAPLVEVFAVDAAGRPWRGRAPTCGTSVGQDIDLLALEPGRWRGAVPAPPQGAFFDLRVDCSLDRQATASARVPVGAPRPDRLALQAWPPELSAEAPRAQVQAFLESAAGERLPAAGITLSADLGRLDVEPPAAAAVRASYDGRPAVGAGADTLRATWRAPDGEGPPRALTVRVDWPAPSEAVLVRARALDAAGRPLPGAPIEIDGPGAALTLEGAADGWAGGAFRPPEVPGPVEVRVTAGGVERRLLALPGDALGPDPDRPDLQATVELPIRAGRVRSVFLSTEPRSLPAVPGQTARVLVRLVDDDGNPVTDEPIVLSATAGVVTRARRRADGTWEATWAPPPNMPYGDVALTVSSERGAFSATSTELEVVPQVVRRAPGLAVGWLFGQRGLSSPYVGLSGDLRLPRLGDRVYARGSVGFYGERIEAVDDVSDQALSMDLDLLPLGLGLLARQDRGRLSGWLGGEVLAVPYRLEARYGETVATSGLGLAPPGVRAFTGGGWRLRGSEIALEVGYTLITMTAPEVGWQGAVGGLQTTAGYRVLF